MSNNNMADPASDLLKIYENDDLSKRESTITNNMRQSTYTTDHYDNSGSEILDTYSQMVRRDISDDEEEISNNKNSQISEEVYIGTVKSGGNSSANSFVHSDKESVDGEDARSGFINRSSSPSKTIIDPEYSETESDLDESDNDFEMPDDSEFDVPDLDEAEDKNEPIFDDNGSVIDIPQKKRVTSTYSEVGSTWNAFPNVGNNDDVQTIITDVKTIYDNNTLMNVPLHNQSSLPPLPKIETLDIGKIKASSREKLTPMEEEEEEEGVEEVKREDYKNFKEYSISNDANKAAENSQLLPLNFGNKKKKFSELSIVKVIQDEKATHVQKLEQLKAYSQELAEHQTELFSWINNTLKSNSELKLKENYVINKHVKEAYSNAEQLSKRNNTHIVSDLNQNMQQLTKKVFTSSMRGKSKSFLKSLREKTTT
ncbi:hypothetical protein QEN19_001592 [Hanseniaspora menglaensis]